MSLILTKPLAFFDIEATGINVSADRIVEISIIKRMPDGSEEIYTKRINPTIPIPEFVSEIHGIYDRDIVDAPTFPEVADEMADFIGDSDLAGYNSNKFDIPMLAEEFLRINHSFDVAARKFVDVQNIFHKMEQRTLAAAYQFYCKKDLENAHSAEADTRATFEVLVAQIEKYETVKGDIDSLAEFSRYGDMDRLDFIGRLVLNKDGDGCYNFGKHKGKTIREVNNSEPGYYGWMMGGDFPLYTKKVLKAEIEKIKAEKAVDFLKQNQHNLAESKVLVKTPPKPDEQLTQDKLNALKSKFGK